MREDVLQGWIDKMMEERGLRLDGWVALTPDTSGQGRLVGTFSSGQGDVEMGEVETMGGTIRSIWLGQLYPATGPSDRDRTRAMEALRTRATGMREEATRLELRANDLENPNQEDAVVDPRQYTAVLAVDAQLGFMPAPIGADELPAPGGDEVAAPLASLAPLARIFAATGDRHPEGHVSFTQQGGPWPPHCVVDTRGAELHPLVAAALTPGWLFAKGTETDADAYSAFACTDLAERLHAAGVRRLLVGGLVTNVCVLATVLDALREGFEVDVALDACRAIPESPTVPAEQAALWQMRRLGARLTTTTELLEARL